MLLLLLRCHACSSGSKLRGIVGHTEAMTEDVASVLEDVKELVHLTWTHVLDQDLEPHVVKDEGLLRGSGGRVTVHVLLGLLLVVVVVEELILGGSNEAVDGHTGKSGRGERVGGHGTTVAEGGDHRSRQGRGQGAGGREGASIAHEEWRVVQVLRQETRRVVVGKGSCSRGGILTGQVVVVMLLVRVAHHVGVEVTLLLLPFNCRVGLLVHREARDVSLDGSVEGARLAVAGRVL